MTLLVRCRGHPSSDRVSSKFSKQIRSKSLRVHLKVRSKSGWWFEAFPKILVNWNSLQFGVLNALTFLLKDSQGPTGPHPRTPSSAAYRISSLEGLFAAESFGGRAA